MMSSRRALIMTLVIAVGLLGLLATLFFTDDTVSVTKTNKPSPAAQASVSPSASIHELNLNLNVSEEEFAALSTLTKTFEKKNPSIRIKLNNVVPAEGQSYYDALKLRAQLARMSDITLMDNNWVEEFAALGYLNNLDDHYVKVPVETYVSNLLLPLKWNGFYWGVPLDFDPYVLTYSDVVVKNYGFNEPAGNLVKWLIQIDRVNADTNRKSEPIYLNADDPYQLLVLDSTVLKKTLKLRGTNSEQLQVRIPRSMEDQQLWGDFKAGRWLFMVTKLSEAIQNQDKQVPITITTIPQKQTIVNNEGLLFEGRSFVVAANSPYKADALAWIRYISDKSVLASWYKDTHQLPSIIESYAAKEIKDQVPRIILDRLDKPVHSLAKPEFPNKLGVLQKQIEDVWAGKTKSTELINTLDSLRATE